MQYVIKEIDGIKVNKVYDNWEDVKPLVVGHKSIYKSFTSEESDALEKFLKAEYTVENFGRGYEPVDITARFFTGKFLFTRSQKGDFYINIYKNRRGGRVTCKGYNLPCNKNMTYSFKGEYKENKEYGMDFIVEEYQEIIEDTKEGIVAYIGSGLFKGVGVKKAEAIYKKFGSRTMYIIENEPKSIKEVKGFSEALAERFTEDFKAARLSREITQYLLKFGISQKYAIDLYKSKGYNSMNFVKNHPYQLCSRYRTITFDLADLIAKDNGLPLNNPERIDYCMTYVLKRNLASGNTGMEYQSFCRSTLKMLGEENVSKSELLDRITIQAQREAISIKKIEHKGNVMPYVFFSEIIDKERQIARDIIRIRDAKPSLEIPNIDSAIRKFEFVKGITYDPLQEKAAKIALSDTTFSVIAGGPGTGKTSIEEVIIDTTVSAGGNVLLLSPTGRAARRMEEATGKPASTIHSHLKIREGDGTNLMEHLLLDESVTIENTTVIADEVSMLDVNIAFELFGAIKDGCRVILIGDPDQLPSVGPGAILRDIINSETVEVTTLKTIFRQSADAKISENAKIINSGEGKIEEGSDFHIHELSNMEDVKNTVTALYLKRIKEYGLENVMCLCPYKEHIGGVNDINKALQDTINPSDARKEELRTKNALFREGDLVMHINHNTEDASNGDIGIITEINSDEQLVKVLINEKEIFYDEDTICDLTLAYAETVHKSQGQEADAVVFMLTRFHRGMLYRNIPYVAISRGKKQVDFVGEMDALYEAMHHEIKNERVTILERFLRYDGCKFVKLA